MGRNRYDPLAPENVLAALMRLAAEADSRRVRKGDRRPRALVEKVLATKRRKARDRVQAAWRRRQAAKPRGVFDAAAFGEGIADRLLAVMQPGAWHGAYDIVRAAGYHDQEAQRSVRGKILQILLPRSLVERRRNPAYHGAPSRKECLAGAAEPPWLYCLTRLGEARREAILLVGVGERAK